MTYLLIIVNVYYLKNSLRTYVQRLLKLALVQLIAKTVGVWLTSDSVRQWH